MDILWIALIVILTLAAGAAWVYYGRNRQVVSELTVMNPNGESGRALVVYHPGKSDFQRRVIVSGFAEGLVSNGWRVEVTTASDRAPTDLSDYHLLVLGGPTYGFTPNMPIRRYLGGLGDLGGQPTVTIITALGMGERSSGVMGTLVRAMNGRLVRSLILYKMRPNDDDNYVDARQNRDLAVEIAAQAAKEIQLP